MARLRPLPDVKSCVRKLPSRTVVPAPAAAPPTSLRAGSGAPLASAATLLATPAAPQTAPPAPLSPDRFRYQCTITAETRDRLARVKQLLSHAVPWGDEAEILDRALRALEAELLKAKAAATGRPGASRGADRHSRTVPADVRREVWARDQARCAFVGTNGHRCTERNRLEFHHVRPYVAGGPATVDNIELRCAAHNRHEARTHFTGGALRALVLEQLEGPAAPPGA
jgi:hypothetical protein